MTREEFLKLSALAALAGQSLGAAQKQPAESKPNADLGFTDTPMLPNLPYHVHDPARPHPPVVMPAAVPGGTPSDAIVLFDGKDLSKWQQRGRGPQAGQMVPAQWKVGDGWFEVAPHTGELLTKDKFGDCQLH